MDEILTDEQYDEQEENQLTDVNEIYKVGDFKKILVVEDLTYVLKTIVKTLSQDGYFTISASTGEEALQKFENYLPDLITVDQRLPDMTGIQLVNKIRALNKTPDTKIVFISGVDDKETIQTILQMGVDEYLLKPFQKQKLIQTVGKLLRK